MEKHLWRKIDIKGLKSANRPCPRWGHTCCVIGDDVVFFGGYADSNYMNDLWTYNQKSMEWEEVATKGTKPTNRSNCSMNYDPINNKIVIFGGGGSNKQRFNAISVLDWATKEWTEIIPKQNEPSPWERTYHSAQLKFPYLVVFGGQGMTDLQDLWIFNFLTSKWTEIIIPQNAARPCARRFHTSTLIGNEMFIIAGCYAKYRCLSDVYSLDLSTLLSTGSPNQLKWKERKVKGSSFLTRWGHSSAVYDKKIYVFGGRFSNDLNDLLVFDTELDTIKNIKIGSSTAPRPRRRHCACFIGSSMLTFGGFNGDYFNDLHYINVLQMKSFRNQSSRSEENARFSAFFNEETYTNYEIKTNDNRKIRINTGLICKYFKSEDQMKRFLTEIDGQYSQSDLFYIMKSLYESPDNLKLKEHCGGKKIFEDQITSFLIEKQEEAFKLGSKRIKTFNEKGNSVIILKEYQFSQFLQNRRNFWYSDATIIVNNGFDKFELNVNRAALSLNSKYFKTIFSNKYQQKCQIHLSIENLIIFEILLNYLTTDFIVIPDSFSCESWINLLQMSDYFCLSKLKIACEQQLCTRISIPNLQSLLQISEQYNLQVLPMHCAYFELNEYKSKTDFNLFKQKVEQKDNKMNKHFQQLYRTLEFDLQHAYYIKISQDSNLLKKKESQSTQSGQEEKENRESNYI